MNWLGWLVTSILIFMMVFVVAGIGWSMVEAFQLSREPIFGQRGKPVMSAHKPDYAKIRRLEIELGLVEPPPADFPPISSGLAQSVQVTGGPFIRHAPPGRREAYLPNDQYGGLRAAQEAAAKWEWCHVCTRRHQGKCAG